MKTFDKISICFNSITIGNKSSFDLVPDYSLFSLLRLFKKWSYMYITLN